MSVEISHKKASAILFSTFNEGLTKEQIGLPAEIETAIKDVLDGPQKTYRYILFTGILAKAANPRCHARSLQLHWAASGAYDARSFCAKVVCPFEVECLDRKLGGSSDPLVNKPGRFESVELSNPTQGTVGAHVLKCVYSVLEHIQADPSAARPALAYVFAHLRTMRRTPALVVAPTPTTATSRSAQGVLAFLNENCGGEASVAVMGSMLRLLFPEAQVLVHHVNEAGRTSRQYGDIDILFSDSTAYAVEVKDKPFRGSDIDHAATFTLNRGAKKLIWAIGPHGETSPVDQLAKTDEWADKGLDLSFLKVADLTKAVLATFGQKEWQGLRLSIGGVLDEMNAKSSTKAKFARLAQDAQPMD